MCYEFLDAVLVWVLWYVESRSDYNTYIFSKSLTLKIIFMLFLTETCFKNNQWYRENCLHNMGMCTCEGWTLISISFIWHKNDKTCYLVPCPGGVLRISSDRDDRMGAKITPPPPSKKNLKQNLTPNKSHVEFSSHKNFQKRPGYAGIISNLQIVLNTPKYPYINQAAPKILAKNFLSQKIPKSKI